MKTFFADLHIHSRYSRATSKNLTLRKLAAWSGIKGLDILTTGDFTHPGWLTEIESELVQEDSGLLRLKEESDLNKELSWFQGFQIPVKTKFILGTEISSIYKKAGQVRKVHNLVFFPGLEEVRKFNKRLEQVGNLASDGRPILGLDSRDLLEMVLDIHPKAFLIPAHIWTPWFSLFGSKSGFNEIQECFEDLHQEIFALETGLSSDPDMNWLWSKLDRYTLVSNSDAHSGEKLGREANIFSGEPSYHSIYQALKGEGVGQKFLGTIEFFPEEGKYHLDGHRKCKVVLDPEETRKLGNVCPVCGKPLTVGVLNRITSLADRKQPKQPAQSPGFTSLIPLPEVLSEILQKGVKTKAVYQIYAQLLNKFGSELNILQNLPPEELRKFSPLLPEGILRMRNAEVYRQPGFDGQFGRISVFSPQEVKESFQGLSLLASKDKSKEQKTKKQKAPDTADKPKQGQALNDSKKKVFTLNPRQEEAIAAGPEPVLVIAGPGTGKTRTLISRVEHLLKNQVNPRHIIVVTFTRAAARELEQRLVHIFGPRQALPKTDTLHAVAFEAWSNLHKDPPVLLSEEEAKKVFQQSNPDLSPSEAEQARQATFRGRENLKLPESLSNSFQKYQEHKQHWNMADYTDLLESWLTQLKNGLYTNPFIHVLVDEIQDLSKLQTEILRQLLPKQGQGFFGIGDPEQSIYGFRGAISNIQAEFEQYWPSVHLIQLQENYRSRQTLLDFSSALFPDKPKLKAQKNKDGAIYFYQAQTAIQEASWIAGQIKRLIGSTAHSQADHSNHGELAPGEIAVLVRFKALIPIIAKQFKKIGLPCHIPEQAPFWEEPRVKLILQTAERFLGIHPDPEEKLPQCPDNILAQGPKALQAYFKDVPPFDHMFWKSQPFQELSAYFKENQGWSGMINQINLESELAAIHQKAQKIHILTLHAAKGLEFAAVFLPVLEQGILPFAGMELLSGKPRSIDRSSDPEEEKRLFYVGLTRASKYLFLSRAKKRQIYGRSHQLPPSEFLNLLSWKGVKKTRSVGKKVKKETQLKLF